MSRALITYASKHGHTAKIAARIADRLAEDGVDAELFDVTSGESPYITSYDAVVVGASIHAGHHQREVVDWAQRRSTQLSRMPSAFFSVCLTAADDTVEARTASQQYIDDFLEHTGWVPKLAVTFAGALQYLEYDFMTRLLLRLMMARAHHPTDASRDYEYTDWDAVDRLADDCAQLLATAVAPA